MAVVSYRGRDDVPEGKHEPIVGSLMVRDFCAECGEALRISKDRIGIHNYCEDCDPPHRGVGNPFPEIIPSDQRRIGPGWEGRGR